MSAESFIRRDDSALYHAYHLAAWCLLLMRRFVYSELPRAPHSIPASSAVGGTGFVGENAPGRGTARLSTIDMSDVVPKYGHQSD